MMKKNIRIIIMGVAIGAVLCLSPFAGVFIFKKVSDRFINTIDRTQDKQIAQFKRLRERFFLSFEDDEDLNIFELNHAGIFRTDFFATDGKYALVLDLPPGPKYPGISFDLFGPHLFDWSSKKSFSFDVFNTTPSSRKLIIQIRSGSKYPKKQFKKEVTLAGMQQTKVHIDMDELGKRLNLEKISHLTIFMANPRTSYRLFIDNMKVE